MRNTIIIASALFIFALLIRIWNLNAMGRAWDEGFYVEQGYTMIKLAKEGKFNDPYWYKDPDPPPLTKYIYGIAAIFDATKNSSIEKPTFNYDFTYSRIISVIIACFSVVVTYLLARQFISEFVGLLSGLILAMLPFYVGLSQLANTESFLVLFFTITLYSFLRFLEHRTYKWATATGILLGLAMLVKYTNALLLPVMVSTFIVWFFYNNGSKKLINLKFVKQLLLIPTFALLTFFVLWPMPFFHMKEVLLQMYNLRVTTNTNSVPEVFFGRLVLVPKWYYVIYFLITTPILLLILFFIGFRASLLSRKWILYTVLAWFLIPFLQSLYNFKQHGVRYIIEIYSPLAIICAVGVEHLFGNLLQSFKYRLFVIIFILLYLFVILFRITPYYLDYFNRFVGGAQGVYKEKSFQLGWWGQGLKEAFVYLEKNSPDKSTVGVAVSQIQLVPKSERLIIKPYIKGEKYDYVVVNFYHVIRDKFDDSYIRKDYKVVHSVKADGAHLVEIYRRNE